MDNQERVVPRPPVGSCWRILIQRPHLEFQDGGDDITIRGNREGLEALAAAITAQLAKPDPTSSGINLTVQCSSDGESYGLSIFATVFHRIMGH